METKAHLLVAVAFQWKRTKKVSDKVFFLSRVNLKISSSVVHPKQTPGTCITELDWQVRAVASVWDLQTHEAD